VPQRQGSEMTRRLDVCSCQVPQRLPTSPWPPQGRDPLAGRPQPGMRSDQGSVPPPLPLPFPASVCGLRSYAQRLQRHLRGDMGALDDDANPLRTSPRSGRREPSPSEPRSETTPSPCRPSQDRSLRTSSLRLTWGRSRGGLPALYAYERAASSRDTTNALLSLDQAPAEPGAGRRCRCRPRTHRPVLLARVGN
jgi:hypothetical protein